MKTYEKLLRAIEDNKNEIIKEFEKQDDTKTCKIDFRYDEFYDYYSIKIKIGDKNGK